MLSAVKRGKCLQLVERAFLFEDLGIGGKRDRRIEDAREPR